MNGIVFVATTPGGNEPDVMLAFLLDISFVGPPVQDKRLERGHYVQIHQFEINMQNNHNITPISQVGCIRVESSVS